MAEILVTSSNPKPEITLERATESDLPSLVALQYRCFSHSTLIEQIANPDTPANRKSTIEKHGQHMRDDPGLRVVKAVARLPSGDESYVHASQCDEGEIVGFCMFYFPTITEDGGKVVQPIPLRPRPATAAPALTSPAATSTDNTLPVPAEIPPPSTGADTNQESSAFTAMDSISVAPTAVQIDISRTNLATLLPYRSSLVASLLNNASPKSATPGGAGYVRYMCVDPSYRRYGIGRRMMEWGCQQYNAEMVDVYLEATSEGEPLYKKFGFQKVGEQVLEVDGVARVAYPCMWRQARESGSL